MRRVLCMLALVGCFGGASTPATPEAPELVDTELQVEELKGCNRCGFEVRSAVRKSAGIVKVKVDLATGRVKVVHLADQVTSEVLHQSLEDLGHPNEVLSTGPHVEEVLPPPEKPPRPAPTKDASDEAPSPEEGEASEPEGG